MKKVNKKLLALLMSATLVTAGAGAFVAFNGVDEGTSISVSAAEITTDRTATCSMSSVAATGDYADAPMFRIAMDTSNKDAAISWGKNNTLNSGTYEYLLEYITFNGKSIKAYRDEYKALLDAGEPSPIKYTGMDVDEVEGQDSSFGSWGIVNGTRYMQPNIAEDVVKNKRAIFAPIFVNATYHDSLGDTIDVYVASSFLAASDITQMGLKAGFELNGYGVSQDVTFYFSGCAGRSDQVDKVVGEITPYKTTETEVYKLDFAVADRFMLIGLSENDYAGTNTTSIPRANLSTLNLYNYIEIDGKKLHSYMSAALGQPFFQVWGREDVFAFNYPDSVDAANVQEVKFLKGCQFPSKAYAIDGGEKMCYQLEKDITFVRMPDGSFVNEATLIKADEVSISNATIGGEANELFVFEIACEKWDFTRDNPADYNYMAEQLRNMRKFIYVNGMSLWDINTTVDDSSYVYVTGDMPNTTAEQDGYKIYSNPTFIYAEKGGHTLRVHVHKDYIGDANEIVVKVARGYKNDGAAIAVGEDVTATVWKKPINVTIDGVAQEGLVYGDKVAKPEDPTKEEAGYTCTFDNWYVVGTDDVYDFETVLEEDVAIESRFTKEVIEYTVTFVADGETVAEETYTVEDKEITVPEVPAKEGYIGSWEAYELTTGNVTVNAVYVEEYAKVSISEALAAADDTKIEVSGTVCVINTIWSEQHGNISVTIEDAEGNQLYLYRMKTNVTVGDVITVKGIMDTYSGKRQVAAGATAEITGHDSSYDYVEMTIVEALATEDNKNVIVTGTVVEIKEAYSSTHNNISVYIADENGTRIYLYRLAGNVEVGQIIKVKGATATYKGAKQITGGTYEAIGTHECSKFTEATCTEAAKCVVCGKANGEALGHSEDAVVTAPTCTEAGYTTYTCTVCGETRVADEVAALGHTASDWIVETEPEIGVAGKQYKECTVCGEKLEEEDIPALEEPAYVEIMLNEGENTVQIPAGKYAMTQNVFAMGDYTVSWTGEASVTVNGEPVENGGVAVFNQPMLNPNVVVITPTNADEACTVVITIAVYEEPATQLVVGENAINVTVENMFCEGTMVEFTAVEAGKYVLKAADGEENADVYIVNGPYDVEYVELPYEFELEAGATVKFNVCTTAYMTLTEDEINLVLEKVEEVAPPTSEEPEVPGDSEEPEVPGDSEEPVDPSEPEEEGKKDKKKGCGSSLGLGMAGALTAVGAALVIKKRKED
ncbi:MAG: hypothetical protein E7364_02845 [Clostridiales bacterium]|nr:hypothetical protein [Clostridiales bacterium]